MFWDIHTVKTRASFQLVFEIPIEQADAAMAILGGMPLPGQERWVGIAPLGNGEDRLATGSRQAAEPSAVSSPEGDRARVRAVMLCKDERFIRWIGYASEIDARDWLCRCLLVPSRSYIATDANVLKQFLAIERKYRQETGLVAEER